MYIPLIYIISLPLVLFIYSFYIIVNLFSISNLRKNWDSDISIFGNFGIMVAKSIYNKMGRIMLHNSMDTWILKSNQIFFYLFPPKFHVYARDYFFIGKTKSCWIDQFKQDANIVLYLYAGAYNTGSIEYDYLADILYDHLKENCNVMMIEYLKMPKYRFPFAIEQVWKVYQYIAKKYPNKKIGIVGISAGANLAINLIKKAIDANLKKPTCLVCCSPWVMNLEKERPIERKYKNLLKHFRINDSKMNDYSKHDFLNREIVQTAMKNYYGENYEQLSKKHSLLNFDFTHFPPTSVYYGSEFLKPEIEQFIHNFKKQNLSIEHKLNHKKPHAYFYFYDHSESIRSDFKMSIKFLIKHLN